MLMRLERPCVKADDHTARILNKAPVRLSSTANLSKTETSAFPSGILARKTGEARAGAMDSLDAVCTTVTKAKKRVTDPIEGIAAAVKPKAPRKTTKKAVRTTPETGQGGVFEEIHPPVTEKKVRKPRAKKNKDEAQPKISKGRITKPGAAKGEDRKAIRRKGSESIKATTSPANGTGNPRLIKPPNAQEDLGLVKATLRRNDWTPPKDTAQMAEGICRTAVSTGSADPASSTVVEPSMEGFDNLLSNFEFDRSRKADALRRVARKADGVALTKRRRIEVSNCPLKSTGQY